MKTIFEFGGYKVEIPEDLPGADIRGIPARHVYIYKKVNGEWQFIKRLKKFAFIAEAGEELTVILEQRISDEEN